MATHTIDNATKFPDGVTVTAHRAEKFGGTPPATLSLFGTADDSQTSSDGSLTFTGLTQQGEYFAVNNSDITKYTRFRAGADETPSDIPDSAVGTDQIADGAITTSKFATGSVDAAAIATGAVGSAEIAADAVGASEIAANAVGSSEIAAGAVDSSEIAAGAVDASHFADDVPYCLDLGTPELADVDRFLLSVVMQATAYTLDETTLPAGSQARNVTLTHTTDTTTDTLGDAVVDGTDIDDNVIQETITLSADGTAAGTKAFKTVTAVTTASWVQAGGVSDTITVGFGNLLGLDRVLTAATQVFLGVLGTAIIAGTAAVDAANLEENTLDLSGGTYDGSKAAKAFIVA